MVDFEYKRFMLKFREIMFDNLNEFRFKDEDICLYHQYIYSGNIDYVYSDKYCLLDNQYTLRTDLLCEKDCLQNHISKNFRYEIRRAEKENVKIKIYDGKENVVNNQLLYEFEKTYNGMFKKKDMSNRFNMKYVKAALENNSMIISVAIDGNTDEYMVFHAYVVDMENTLLLYSTSKKWMDKKIENLVGYANKYLHWTDICYFKDTGRINYEWGGISSKDNPNGIDKFKMSFGGDIIQLKNCIVANSTKGNLYVKLLKERSKMRNEDYN